MFTKSTISTIFPFASIVCYVFFFCSCYYCCCCCFCCALFSSSQSKECAPLRRSDRWQNATQQASRGLWPTEIFRARCKHDTVTKTPQSNNITTKKRVHMVGGENLRPIVPSSIRLGIAWSVVYIDATSIYNIRLLLYLAIGRLAMPLSKCLSSIN